MGLSLGQLNQTMVDCSWVTVSLDGLLDRDNSDAGSAPTELPADPNEEDFTQRLERRQMIDALTGAVKQLPESEWLIVSLYYRDGNDDEGNRPDLEISESRVASSMAALSDASAPHDARTRGLRRLNT